MIHHAKRLSAGNITLLAGGLIIAAGPSCAPRAPDQARESLGRVSLPVTCEPSVQDEFDYGVALLHHMTYPVAHAAFERVTEADPDCAMGYWGIALTLFQPLWPTRPGEQDLRDGWAAVQEAQQLQAPTERERMYVATAAAFFDPAGTPDYATRISRWVEATEALHEAHPDDQEAGALFALTLLATERSARPGEHRAEAADVLLAIYGEEPTHPGALHYTIHANDFVGRERESLELVRAYGEVAPNNPHALHMPTHIFVRLGEWQDVISWNERSSAAALAQKVGPNEEWVWDEFPHAVEYLSYAHLQRADDSTAVEVIRTLHETMDLQPSFKTAFHLASTSARYALERRAWSEAEQLPVRSPSSLNWDRFQWPEAITWFARGLGAAHNGAIADARAALDQMNTLEQRAVAPFAVEIQILRLELAAWIAWSSGDADGTVQLMREAAALEATSPKNPVTPAGTIPAGELLGDLLTEIGDARGALAAFQAADARAPDRYNTLLGAARAAATLGDTETASDFYRRLQGKVAPNSPRPGLTEA